MMEEMRISIVVILCLILGCISVFFPLLVKWKRREREYENDVDFPCDLLKCNDVRKYFYSHREGFCFRDGCGQRLAQDRRDHSFRLSPVPVFLTRKTATDVDSHCGLDGGHRISVTICQRFLRNGRGERLENGRPDHARGNDRNC